MSKRIPSITVNDAAEVMMKHRWGPNGGGGSLILSGAGMSTASGLPDYRSPVHGLYSKGHKPITLQQFMSGVEQRRRYWARSAIGYHTFFRAEPNAAHEAVAAMLLNHSCPAAFCITQNVDGLHEKALSKSSKELLIELHGNLHYALCTRCNHREHRVKLQSRIASLNDRWMRENFTVSKNEDADEFTRKSARPDGDHFLRDEVISGFRLPPCVKCGGGDDSDTSLRPHVVLFGDFIPSEIKRAANEQMEAAGVLLCCGTSLEVPSAFHFARHCIEKKKLVLLFNDGDTRLDREPKWAAANEMVFKVEGRLEETLPALAALF